MLLLVLATIGIVLAMVGLGVLIDRRWALLPKPEELRELEGPPPPSSPAPGEAPTTAARHDQRRRVLAAQRCCGAVMAVDEEESVRYDGHELVIVRLRCACCGSTRSVYVEPSLSS